MDAYPLFSYALQKCKNSLRQIGNATDSTVFLRVKERFKSMIKYGALLPKIPVNNYRMISLIMKTSFQFLDWRIVEN